VLFWSGYYAVITFFVISGFLITNLSVKRWKSLGDVHIGRFYTMRAARILPCLLLVLLVLSILHLTGTPDFTIKSERASLGRALWAAVTFHVNWLEGRHGYLPGGWDVLWSLSVEETFYLVFPVMCLVLRSERFLLLPLFCLVLLGPINRTLLADEDPWGQYAYLSCMDGIAFGCLAALVCARLRLSTRTLRLLLVTGAAAAVLVILLFNEDEHVGLSRLALNITLLEASIAMMLVALGSGVGNAALPIGTAWLRWIGRASYEIYLFHMFVVLSLMTLFKRLQPAATMIPGWYVAMLLLSVFVGVIVSKFYSEPLNRRLRAREFWHQRAAKSLAAAPVIPD
jgi:peptidoglycan/LPS O-acetylase OafA/YrhL